MTFSRDFKSQTYFVYLPTQAIESFAGDTIERAFLAGTLSPSTPVRHINSTIWMPLSEAAGFEEEDRPSLTNLVGGVTFEFEPKDEAWKTGSLERRSFRSRFARAGAVLLSLIHI